MTTYALGRRPEFDERSRAYPASALFDVEAPLVSRTWDLPTYLDQGSEGACVGFSLTHEILAEPVTPSGYPADWDWTAYARGVYYNAQTRDEWPGESYEGTSVLAGAKTLAALGWLDEYRWAFGAADVLDVLAQHGPVVLGVDWYYDMFDPDDEGLVHPTGGVAGGHAILCRGIDVADQTVLLHNSWGTGWGHGGNAWLRFEDLDYLLRQDGEACVPVLRAVPGGNEPIPPPPEPGCLSLRGLRRLWRR